MASFLRSRRARISPQDVGLPPGPRRRTPGLRREEVAQLAGVGVTWYTWLEQGRPINASAQVLDAVSRTLRLDPTEREHLYQLAGVPFVSPAGGPADAAGVSEDVQRVLDALNPLPAVVYNSRYDVLGDNATYHTLFAPPGWPREAPRNVLRALFTAEPTRCPLVFRDSELKIMVATTRAAYGRHVGDPVWERFVADLSLASPEFAGLWASGDVVPPGPRTKTFRHEEEGLIRLRSESLSVNGMPEARLVVYIPADEDSRAKVERLSAQAVVR
ncbi:XRE family transcriptional regulator [Streptomyces hoynatensis]|uniref:XRE family transcriptional regulator n=1 Tax=Streptomyces hoynatensis TaxID=1141874 RepID=A0A3A9YJ37_9ACTN|nr:XRE family transcriptional regulator [Streptomyces hoynatensis]